MKVVIVGQKAFGAALLDLARSLGHEVALVCAPKSDRLYAAAVALSIPRRTSIEPANVPAGTDVILAAHCHIFLSADVRNASRLGTLGYHPSLLPLHRGRDAIRWVIHMRERVTGGTVYWMTDEVDAGDVAAQATVHVRAEDTPAELWRRELMPLGLRLFARVLGDLQEGRVIRRPQSECHATWEPSFERPPLAPQPASPKRGRVSRRRNKRGRSRR
jgi:methionyl-tRNA formyltransferase